MVIPVAITIINGSNKNKKSKSSFKNHTIYTIWLVVKPPL